MDTALGILGMVLWIAVTIAVAYGITYAVVKAFPEREKPKATPES
jgi:hypothetical protein